MNQTLSTNKKINNVKNKPCRKKSPKNFHSYYNDISDKIRDNQILTEKNFFIPLINEYELLLNYNYKIKQLQKISKFYKLKVTGKKSELLNNVYNYLKLCNHTIILQKNIRGFLLRKYNFYRGPAYFNRKLCNNETDFFTLEKVEEIDNHQLISFKNEEGFVYGFDIVSLYNWILKNKKPTVNPYDRKNFPSYLFENIKKIIRLSKALNININIKLDDVTNSSNTKLIEFRVISLFQKIDEYGFITNIEWFNSLSRNNLIKYIRELGDIWNYRAQLDQTIKNDICPPNGNPFRDSFIQSTDLLTCNLINLKLSIIKVMERLVNSASSNENKSLGAFYVLSALTLVNSDAAESLPWLYQSVAHIN